MCCCWIKNEGCCGDDDSNIPVPNALPAVPARAECGSGGKPDDDMGPITGLECFDDNEAVGMDNCAPMLKDPAALLGAEPASPPPSWANGGGPASISDGMAASTVEG